MDKFKLMHFGINAGSAEEAKKVANQLAVIFGFSTRETAISTFSSEGIEVMNGNGPGKNGHFAIGTPDVKKAKEYLESKGVSFDESSAKYSENGTLWLIYASDEIAGFAWHLVKC